MDNFRTQQIPGQPAGTIQNGHFRSYNQIQTTHLMPPYIEILFAPRRPIPYVPPVKKPYLYKFTPVNDGITDLKAISEKLAKMREERLLKEENEVDLDAIREKFIKNKGRPEKEKEQIWKSKMSGHVVKQNGDLKKWKNELKNPDYEHVTKDPFKTLIVYRLVAFDKSYYIFTQVYTGDSDSLLFI